MQMSLVSELTSFSFPCSETTMSEKPGPSEEPQRPSTGTGASDKMITIDEDKDSFSVKARATLVRDQTAQFWRIQRGQRPEP